jgi:hypothetical protein
MSDLGQPSRRITSEAFEALLLEVDLALAEIGGGEQGEASREDVRPVWHAAEVALGILHPGYVPMPEALIERARIAVDELRRVDSPLDPESVARSMDLRTMPEFIEVVRWANEIAAAKVLRED